MVSEPNRILDAMLALLAEPTSWTKHHLAAERVQDTLLPLAGADDPRANCFCLVGARERVIDTQPKYEVNDRILAAIQTLFPDRHTKRGRYNLPTFNDHPLTTHADVLDVLRLARAIA